MSQKFFKTVTAVAVVCCLLFLAGGAFQLGKQASARNDVSVRQFGRLDKAFMNQLKINDTIPEELKTILREEVRINPDIDSVTILRNKAEIFSARKADAEGIAVYDENRNLILTRQSKPYALDKSEIYTLAVRFRILSETDLNRTFFCLLMSFLCLSIVIAACAVIPLRRKKSPAGPLFDQIEAETQNRTNYSFSGTDTAPEPTENEFSETIDEAENSFLSDLYESDDEEEILDLDELTANETAEEEKGEIGKANPKKTTETDVVIDLNFKENTFHSDAQTLIEKTVDLNENCILLITEFRSNSDTQKDETLRDEWLNCLIQADALCKTDRKKTIAVLPRCTLTDGIKLIQDFRESRPDREEYMWNAGMTALNGRKLRYEDMYNEASRALIKSQLDNDNTVVCFNADAEKYNRYSKID